jgi:hypothetical protein
MKIRIISSREEINSVRPNERAIHLAFRASNVDFLNLIKRVPRLQMIQVPPSYMKTMSKSIGVFLDMQGVKFIEGDVWGHRKDLDEYFTVSDEALKTIRYMAKAGSPSEDIAKKVQQTTKLGTELIEYIAIAEIEA